MEDVAAVAAEALIHPEKHAGRAYDLTGPEAADYTTVADVLQTATGKKTRYEDPGILGFVAHRLREGDPLAYVAVTTAIYATARAGLAGQLSTDVAHVLGRQPRSLRDFAAANAEQLRG